MAQMILLVDDDDGFLLAVRHLLEGAGYEVTTASSAAEARTRLESETPDLILLDVIMPGKDGFSFAEELSEAERLAGIPVVLVTAVADNAGRMMQAFEVGRGCAVTDILPKAVAHEQLLDTVARALGAEGPGSDGD